MTQTMSAAGRPLYFPASLGPDPQGVIPAPPPEELAHIAQAVAPDGLMLFTKRLVDGARKRRFSHRWCEVNRSRLHLAQLCIERALAEQFSCTEADDGERL